MLFFAERRRRRFTSPFFGFATWDYGVPGNVIDKFLSNSRRYCGMMSPTADLGGALQFKNSCERVDQFKVGVAGCLCLIFTFTRSRVSDYYLSLFGNRRDRVDRCDSTYRTDANYRRVMSYIREYAVLRRIQPNNSSARVCIAFIVIRRLRNSVTRL